MVQKGMTFDNRIDIYKAKFKNRDAYDKYETQSPELLYSLKGRRNIFSHKAYFIDPTGVMQQLVYLLYDYITVFHIIRTYQGKDLIGSVKTIIGDIDDVQLVKYPPAEIKVEDLCMSNEDFISEDIKVLLQLWERKCGANPRINALVREAVMWSSVGTEEHKRLFMEQCQDLQEEIRKQALDEKPMAEFIKVKMNEIRKTMAAPYENGNFKKLFTTIDQFYDNAYQLMGDTSDKEGDPILRQVENNANAVAHGEALKIGNTTDVKNLQIQVQLTKLKLIQEALKMGGEAVQIMEILLPEWNEQIRNLSSKLFLRYISRFERYESLVQQLYDSVKKLRNQLKQYDNPIIVTNGEFLCTALNDSPENLFVLALRGRNILKYWIKKCMDVISEETKATLNTIDGCIDDISSAFINDEHLELFGLKLTQEEISDVKAKISEAKILLEGEGCNNYTVVMQQEIDTIREFLMLKALDLVNVLLLLDSHMSFINQLGEGRGALLYDICKKFRKHELGHKHEYSYVSDRDADMVLADNVLDIITICLCKSYGETLPGYLNKIINVSNNRLPASLKTYILDWSVSRASSHSAIADNLMTMYYLTIVLPFLDVSGVERFAIPFLQDNCRRFYAEGFNDYFNKTPLPYKWYYIKLLIHPLCGNTFDRYVKAAKLNFADEQFKGLYVDAHDFLVRSCSCNMKSLSHYDYEELSNFVIIALLGLKFVKLHPEEKEIEDLSNAQIKNLVDICSLYYSDHFKTVALEDRRHLNVKTSLSDLVIGVKKWKKTADYNKMLDIYRAIVSQLRNRYDNYLFESEGNCFAKLYDVLRTLEDQQEKESLAENLLKECIRLPFDNVKVERFSSLSDFVRPEFMAQILESSHVLWSHQVYVSDNNQLLGSLKRMVELLEQYSSHIKKQVNPWMSNKDYFTSFAKILIFINESELIPTKNN